MTSDLVVQLIFITKYSGNVLTQEILDEMHGIFSNICHKYQATLLDYSGSSDQVSLTIRYPAKYAVSQIVNSLKGVSSRLVRKKNYAHLKPLGNEPIWSPSYFAGTLDEACILRAKSYLKDIKAQ